MKKLIKKLALITIGVVIRAISNQKGVSVVKTTAKSSMINANKIKLGGAVTII